ncbi:TPA: acetyltransferase [Providencia rettgeri]
MGKLYLLGAGSLAREIYSYLKESDFVYQGYNLIGFLTDFSDVLDSYNVSHPILDKIYSTKVTSNDAVIIAVADCAFKQQLFNFYNNDVGCKIITYIHPSAYVGSNVEIGAGCVICPHATITTDIKIGNGVTINMHSSIGHDARLDDFCTLSCHCDVTGYVHLKQGVFMGSHALVIPKTEIGEGAVLGAGAVVITKVKPGATMFGNPARQIK